MPGKLRNANSTAEVSKMVSPVGTLLAFTFYVPPTRIGIRLSCGKYCAKSFRERGTSVKPACVFATLALLFALPVRADTIYQVNATASIIGNDACNGVCMETVTFSVMVDQPSPFDVTNVLPGGTFTSSGPIPLGSGPITWVGPVAAEGYIGWGYVPPGGFGGDELDVFIGCGDIPYGYTCTPGLNGIDGTRLYSCGDMTCVNDFCPDGCAGFIPPNYYGWITYGPLVGTMTVVHTPEPGTAGLLILGIGLLALAGRCARAYQRRGTAFWRQLASIAQPSALGKFPVAL